MPFINNMGELRWQFYKVSGRADLVAAIDEVNKTCSDNGADHFINRGLRHLDLLQETPTSRARVILQILANSYFTELPDCRSIDGVYMLDGGGNRTRLEKCELEWLRSNYATAFEDVTTSTPLYYAQNVIEVAPQNQGDTSATFTSGLVIHTLYDWQDLAFTGSAGVKGLLYMPPADDAYTLVVYGRFFTSAMTSDSDSCFWIDEYPNLVVWAACREVEVAYRNSEGVNDWDRAIASELRGIDFDLAEQDSNELVKLEG